MKYDALFLKNYAAIPRTRRLFSERRRKLFSHVCRPPRGQLGGNAGLRKIITRIEIAGRHHFNLTFHHLPRADMPITFWQMSPQVLAFSNAWPIRENTQGGA